MVDIARDARWGRGVEGAGEDTCLGSRFATARVRGFQGDDLTSATSVMACAQHFAAYCAAQSGLDYNPVDISDRPPEQVYFPPFPAALAAGCGNVLASFNHINAAPAHPHHSRPTEL